MSTVSDLMRTDIIKISHGTSIAAGAKRMRDERIGALFVEKEGALVGIVTETDVIRRAVADGTDLSAKTVEEIMTAPIATIESVRTMQDAHDMMGDLNVRHLGVTQGGTIVGVVSVRDLLVYFKRVSEPKIAQD